MQPLISVPLEQNSYNIHVAPGQLSQLGDTVKQLEIGKKILIISNPEIFNYYGEITVNSLQKAEFDVNYHLIPAGESYKNLEEIRKIYDTALSNKLERSSTMLALGGGVIGDMTGFAAATWLRGINFIQVPTSLLAMVDAAIGGKTGVNHPKGKNLIGAFYQPKLVYIDPLVLKTLPVREFRAGMAEVIKYGIIWDADLFSQLENASRLDSLEFISEELLYTIITHSCQAKADVVSQDEKEANLRAILNYGHTIAHAIESLTNYETFVHGEAVAIGMVIAGKIALSCQLWTENELQRQNKLIEKTGLPTQIPNNLSVESIIKSLENDKKVKDGKGTFILPTQIGKAEKVKITDEILDLLREIIVNS